MILTFDQLNEFCAGPDRPTIERPFKYHGRVYATNGIVMVSIPEPENFLDGDERAPHESAEKILMEAHANAKFSERFLEIVKEPKEYKKPCNYCKHNCPTCYCHEVCSECDGGVYRWKEFWPIRIDGVLFNSRYLLLIKTLPNLKIGKAVDAKPLPFIFSDGVGMGILMPLRDDSSEHEPIIEQLSGVESEGGC